MKNNETMQVSEECLGKMLADRYTMFKTAEVKMGSFSLPTLPKFLSQSGGALSHYFGQMVIPLAIAGGLKLVNDASKREDAAKLNAQADSVFNHLRRTNEYVQSNPTLAAEAFDTLRSFAPSMASKAIIARSFIENVVKAGQLPVDTASMLINTEEHAQNVKKQQGGEGFIDGLKTPMSLFSYSMGGKKEDPKQPVKKPGIGDQLKSIRNLK